MKSTRTNLPKKSNSTCFIEPRVASPTGEGYIPRSMESYKCESQKKNNSLNFFKFEKLLKFFFQSGWNRLGDKGLSDCF